MAVSFELGGTTLGSYFQGQASVNSFDSRFNATWVPTKLTLIVFDVTSDDKGEYVCRVQFFSGGLKSWLRKIAVDVLGKFIDKQLSLHSCYVRVFISWNVFR